MADLLAELEGLLDADTIAKIRGNEAVKSRFERASEVVAFYDGEDGAQPPARREPEARTEPRAATGDLSALTAQLAGISTKLDGLDATIESKVAAVVKTRGDELVNNAIAISMRNTRELSKLDARNRADFGTELDDDALAAHVNKAVEEGRPFRSITQAYEDMTQSARVAKEVDAKVAEAKKEAVSSASVPGVSGTVSSPVLKFMRAAGKKSGDAGTVADKAGEALRARLAERGEAVA